jgi:hypothetical protein
VRLSTLLEIAGFACLSIAAFQWSRIAGLVAVGLSLLLIGYATDDERASSAVYKLVHPLVRLRAGISARRSARREARIGAKP